MKNIMMMMKSSLSEGKLLQLLSNDVDGEDVTNDGNDNDAGDDEYDDDDDADDEEYDDDDDDDKR